MLSHDDLLLMRARGYYPTVAMRRMFQLIDHRSVCSASGAVGGSKPALLNATSSAPKSETPRATSACT